MAGGRDGHQFVLEKNRGFQFLGFKRPFGQAQFNRAFEQGPLNLLGVGGFHLQFNVGITAMKFREHSRQKIAADREARAQGQPPALQAAIFLNRPRRVLLQRTPAMGVIRQNLPRLGQPAAARQAVQQADAQRTLQFGDLFGNRRLADPRRSGAAADAAGLRNGVKQGQVIPIHDIIISYG